MLNVELSLLSVLCLASCDGYHVVDVINRATTRKIVNRTGNTLEDRTDSDGTTQALNTQARSTPAPQPFARAG